jgi:hypothetical protein
VIARLLAKARQALTTARRDLECDDSDAAAAFVAAVEAAVDSPRLADSNAQRATE